MLVLIIPHVCHTAFLKYTLVIKKDLVSEKQLFVIGDINVSSLDYESNNTVKKIFNIITRPTRVTRHSWTVIDHIVTNAILTKNISSGIVKTDISDLFLTFTYIDEEIIMDRKAEKTIFKRPVYSYF